MIFFTHYRFRRQRDASNAGSLPGNFKMWGFPWLTLLGASLMIVILIMTAFVDAFRMTLITGVPFLLILTVLYFSWYRAGAPKPNQLVRADDAAD